MTFRESLAARLREIATRVEPRPPRRSPAPLVRIGGVWWHRSDWAQPQEEPSGPAS